MNKKAQKPERKHQNVVLRLAAWFLWFVGGLILLVFCILIVIQLPVVKRRIARLAKEEVNKQLNAKISVGELSGNFFTNIRLGNVLLRDELGDTIVFVPSLQLNYDLLPLLYGEMMVQKIAIEKPYIHLKQLNDSTWNFQHIAKPSEKKDTTSAEFNMQIQLKHLALKNALICLEAHNNRHNFKLQELDLQAKYNKTAVQLNHLSLQTAQNALSANGEYYFGEEKAKLYLQTQAIVLKEFAYFLPKDFSFPAKPALTLETQLNGKHLQLNVRLEENIQNIDLQLSTSRLIDYLQDTATIVTYDLNVQLNKIDVAHWLNNPSLHYNITGTLNAQGKGLNPKTLTADVMGYFGNVILQGNDVKQLNLQLHYSAGDANGKIVGNGTFGSLVFTPDVKALWNKQPVYSAGLHTQNFNLAYFLGDDYASDINLDASLNGTGFDLNSITAQAFITVSPSKIMDIQIDTLYSDIAFKQNNILINELFAKAFAAQLHAHGNYSFKDTSDIALRLQLADAKPLASYFHLPYFQTKLSLDTHLSGTPNHLTADTYVNVGKTQYATMSLDSLSAIAHAVLVGKDILINADIKANTFDAGGFVVDAINLKTETDTKNIRLQLSAENQDIKTHLNSSVNVGENIRIALSNLFLSYKNYDWQQTTDTAYIHINKDDYQIADFQLASGAEKQQTIVVEGKFSLNADEDFSLHVNNVEIPELLKLFAPEQQVSGLLNFGLQLSGTAQSPIVSAKLNADRLELQKHRFNDFESEFSYKNRRAKMNLNILSEDSIKVFAVGRMPTDLRLDSMKITVPNVNDSVSLRLIVEKLPLSLVNAFVPADEASGYIRSHIDVRGMLGNPSVSGKVKLTDGKFAVKPYGIDYKNIQMGIGLHDDFIKIDTFLIQSRDGNVRAEGEAKFLSKIYNGKFNTSDIKLTFNRFNPINHKYYNMQLSGNVNLHAGKDSASFSGKLSIPESLFYLPALFNTLGETGAPDTPKPLLAAELEKMKEQQDSTTYRLRAKEKTGDNLAFLNNLKGTLNINIPRNTWVKNDDMRMELSGDVELMKHKELVEIFGNINIVRGQYSLLGKVFVIQSGMLTFMGGKEINPAIELEAEYTFRDAEREKQMLTLKVSGKALEPQIQFSYQGSDINEGDAISYILFGTNLDALTSGQQENLNSSGLNASDMGSSLAASLISSQLTRFLGNALNVDYIEVKGDASFDNASFTVGKYLTSNLFVSYEQNIGAIDDPGIARYEMSLEYELFRFLFLQLTSSSITNGIDLIFKLNKK